MHVLKPVCEAEVLLSRVQALMQNGHRGAARSLLAAARRLGPPSPRHVALAARLAMQDGRLDEAREELEAGIADTPESVALRKLRAELRRTLGDHAGAAADAAEAVVLDPRDPVAKALLGVSLLDLKRASDAVVCLREAVSAQPSNQSFRTALAAALDASDDPSAALATLTEGIALAPAEIGLRNAAVLHCIRCHDFANAVQLAQESRVAGVMDACLFGMMGHALSSLGRHKEAAEAYATALELGPEDPYVRHLAAAAGTIPCGIRAPAEYLRAVFDGCADRFDAHLISLRYRVPGLIRAALQARGGLNNGPVLDLGCGTGLMAVVLGDLNLGPFTGVDISGGMLTRAAAKELYAELQEADMLDFLRDDVRTWPLILAGDSLCYFGVLDSIFTAIRARLEPGGLFICSVETLRPDYQGVVQDNGDWALGQLGRYLHGEAYVLRVAEAAGFKVCQSISESLRDEVGAPVQGLIVLLERDDAH